MGVQRSSIRGHSALPLSLLSIDSCVLSPLVLQQLIYLIDLILLFCGGDRTPSRTYSHAFPLVNILPVTCCARTVSQQTSVATSLDGQQ